MTVRDLPEVAAARGSLASRTSLTDGDGVSAVVVGVAPSAEGDEGAQPRAGTVDASILYRVDLAEMADRAHLRGAAGDVLVVDLPRPHRGVADAFPWADLPPRVVLLGLGASTPADLRHAGAALARVTTGLGEVVCAATAGASTEALRAFVEGYLLGAHTPVRMTSEPPPAGSAPARRLVLLDPGRDPEADVEPVLARARTAAGATWWARDLTATPASVKDPAWFAAQAREAADALGLRCTELGPRELAAQGFGGILAVGAGSVHPPRLVTVTYEPADEDRTAGTRHVAVVGSGITYDTGGLAIRPRLEMVPMKTAVAGAAVALAAVVGAARDRSPHRVTAVLPLAENAFGAASYRAGDVVTTWGGTTVEVVRTDAAGRLVLADALAWAAAELAPDLLVDVATLTAAAGTALGPADAPLLATDDALAGGLEAAAAATGERVWRMPLVADYAPTLRSDLADQRQLPSDAPGAGAVVAALFLREHVGDVPWAHLDIAGTARATKARHEVGEGATGFGARLVLRWLEDLGGSARR